MDKQSNVTTATIDQKDLKRQLQGSAFLSLEHWAYMVLVVALPVVLLAGFFEALALWTDRGSMMSSMMGIMNTSNVVVGTAIMYAATLLTLAPLMYILRRRTASEFVKRPHYKERLAYKLPIYSALAILGFLKTFTFIGLLAIFLQSLALIGIQGADIGNLYLTQFLPCLLALIVFGFTSWYLFKLAKGIDNSAVFSLTILVVSGLMAVTLLITAVSVAHKPQPSNPLLLPEFKQNMPHNNYNMYGN